MERSKIDVPERTIADFCRRWRIAELALFGSVLGEEFGPDSDVDVLVTFASDAHLSSFDLIRMKEELQTIFGREVALVEKAALRNPFRRKTILNNLEVIYAS
ncbi:MAG: nucleotidyltransferase domain-containing protein [Dehalococcoidia bacterium]|nr:nucleotidyltransferase domain-containing protein [Dehalococcoidia bacterium]